MYGIMVLIPQQVFLSYGANYLFFTCCVGEYRQVEHQVKALNKALISYIIIVLMIMIIIMIMIIVGIILAVM